MQISAIRRRSRRSIAVAVAALVLGGGVSELAPAQVAAATTAPVHASSTVSIGWVGRAIRAGWALNGISCPSASICYAAGGDGNGNSMVEKTTNGGASWVATSFVTSSIGTFDDISCADTLHCIATGGGNGATAYRTLNGSAWSPTTLPGGTTELNSVSCVSDTRCFALSFGGEGVQTANFGSSWTPLDYPVTSPSTSPTSGNGIFFQTASIGWVVSEDKSCSTSNTCHGYIEKTINGGSTWTTSDTINGVPVVSISCGGASACVAIGADSGRMVTYRTANSGASWSTSFGPNNALGVAVTCPTAAYCYAAGAENLVFDNSGNIKDATAAVLRSTNGGVSWSLEQVTNGLSFLGAVSCATGLTCVAAGINPTAAAVATTSNGGVPPATGYYLVASDGGIFSFGNAPFHGSTGNMVLNKPIVGMAVDASGGGYWMVASDGGIFSFGNAPFHGSTGNIRLAKPIVGMTIDPVTGGYWMVASDGGIFSFDAPYLGSKGGQAISAPIVGMKAMADGSGYYLVAADGTVYPFGTAQYETCAGKPSIAAPVVNMATDRVDGDYWVANNKGAVANCGLAPFYGDTHALQLTRPVVGISSTPDGHGYWLVATDGGIFTFGDAKFLGSTGAMHLNKPIIGIATVPST